MHIIELSPPAHEEHGQSAGFKLFQLIVHDGIETDSDCKLFKDRTKQAEFSNIQQIEKVYLCIYTGCSAQSIHVEPAVVQV